MYVARMSDHHTPKICLFSQLQPLGGPRLRWKDLIRRDLHLISVPEDKCGMMKLWHLVWMENYLQERSRNTHCYLDHHHSKKLIKSDGSNTTFRRTYHKCISQSDKSPYVSSAKLHNVYFTEGGLEAVEGFLSMDVYLTKLVTYT